MQNTNETKSHSTDVSDGQELFKRDLQMPEKKIHRYYSITDSRKAAILSRFSSNALPTLPSGKWGKIPGDLRFFVHSGHNLPDEDGWLNDSDPYVEFIVYRHDGTHVRRISSTKGGTQDPRWYESVYIGYGRWRKFKIRVWDSDRFNSDDPLSDQRTVAITRGYHPSHKFNCYRGYITYDYLYYFP